jgi:PEP-CTERM motif
MSIRPIVFAIVLALCTAFAQAGTVTWQFVETTGGSGAGTIGGLLTLNSPPVDLTPGVAWTATTPDLVDLTVLDPEIGPVGSYNLSLNVASILEGLGPDFVNVHEVSGQSAAGDVAFSNINEAPGLSDLGVGLAGGGGGDAFGDWVLAPASVPEPSSLVLAGIAALAGLGAWRVKQGRI